MTSRLDIVKIGLLTLLALIVVPGGMDRAAGQPLGLEKVDPVLLDKLVRAGPSDEFVVRAFFADRPEFDHNQVDELPPVNRAYVDRLRSMAGAESRFVDELNNALSLEALAQPILEIAKIPFITRIEEVPKLSTASHHSAVSHGDLANPMSAIYIEDLHHAGYDGTGITIAVLDSGVDMTHNALAPKAGDMGWKDFVNGMTTPYDDVGHGTAVAALALGFDNSNSYLGAAYDASLLAVKVCVPPNICLEDAVIEGLKFAVWRSDIINVSIRRRYDSSANCVEMNGRSLLSIWTGWAVSQGATVVGIAGNSGESADCDGIQIEEPGDNFNAITVGATDPFGTTIAPFSSRGPTRDGRLKPDVVAPGMNIIVACIPTDSRCIGGYRSANGTSYAAPLVSGAIASIMEKWNALSVSKTPARVKAALRQTALDLGDTGPDNTFGFGLIRATQASDAAVDMAFAWDDGFTVQTSFASFVPREILIGNALYISIQSMSSHGYGMVGAYEIPWIEAGLSGWIRLDHSILRAGPYIREATPTSLVFDATFRTPFITYHFLVRLREISVTQVEFKTQLEAVTILDRTINARLYLDLNIDGSCCDFFQRISDGSKYRREARVEATNIRTNDTGTPRTAEIYYNLQDSSPYEWLLAFPGDRDNPDLAVNGQSIDGTDVVFEYQSRKGSTPSGTTIQIGPTLYLNTPPGAGGGGSPYLSTFDGSAWLLDNNLMPAAEHSNGREVTDYYRVQQPLRAVSERYILKISEFENAHNFIDQVRLLTVDHAAGYHTAVSPTGQILTYSNPIPAQNVRTLNGTDVTMLLDRADGLYYEQSLGDFLYLNFSNVQASATVKLLVRSDPQGCPTPCQKSWFDVFLLTANGGWLDIADIFPRKFWSYDIMDLSPFLALIGNHIVVRIGFDNAHGHRIDFTALDTTVQRATTTAESALILAVHSKLGDVTTRVARDDTVYAEIVPDQYIVFAFRSTSQADQVRDFILIVNGYYVPITA